MRYEELEPHVLCGMASTMSFRLSEEESHSSPHQTFDSKKDHDENELSMHLILARSISTPIPKLKSNMGNETSKTAMLQDEGVHPYGYFLCHW